MAPVNDTDHLLRLREADLELARERDRRYEQRFEAQEQAIAVATENERAWRANANEWRATVNDLIQRSEGKETHQDITMARLLIGVGIVVSAIVGIAAILVGAFT